MISLAVATIVIVGTLVGVEFAVAVFFNPIMRRLPVDSSIAARSDGGRLLGKIMPFWYIGSLVLIVGWVVLGWGHPASGAALASAILFAVSVVMSIVFLVPINSRSVKWASEGAPDDWREQAARWDRLHYVRVAVIVAGFAFATVALALAGA